MKLVTKLLFLLALFGFTAMLGCGPEANPENASGESEPFDEEAYAKEMEEEAARVEQELGQE